MRFKRIVLFLVLSFILCETNLSYEQYLHLREVGSKFEVAIEELRKEDIKKIGLTEERLRTVAELRLRKEGMTIVNEKSRKVPAEGERHEIPVVYVNVCIVGPAYNIDLMICEDVVLKRPSSVTWIFAPTWGREITGTHVGDSEKIISSLNQLFDSFFNDYYKANPKEAIEKDDRE